MPVDLIIYGLSPVLVANILDSPGIILVPIIILVTGAIFAAIFYASTKGFFLSAIFGGCVAITLWVYFMDSQDRGFRWKASDSLSRVAIILLTHAIAIAVAGLGSLTGFLVRRHLSRKPVKAHQSPFHYTRRPCDALTVVQAYAIVASLIGYTAVGYVSAAHELSFPLNAGLMHPLVTWALLSFVVWTLALRQQQWWLQLMAAFITLCVTLPVSVSTIFALDGFVSIPSDHIYNKINSPGWWVVSIAIFVGFIAAVLRGFKQGWTLRNTSRPPEEPFLASDPDMKMGPLDFD